MRWLGLAAAPLLFLVAPVLAVLAVLGTLFVGITTSGDPDQQPEACTSTSAVATSTVSELQVQNSDGDSVTLGASQLENAAAIIAVGKEMGVSSRGVRIALMTALVESTLKMWANSTVPESLEHDHDAVGSDHDSVGLFQQRPSAGWGDVDELMDARYSAQAFYGGPEGPNGGRPAGLLDVPGWEQLGLGEAAQRVQVSAFPDRYDEWSSAAQQIINALGGACVPSGSGEAALPLNPPFIQTSGFGPRNIGGNASTWHAAVDLINPGVACGQPVYAVLPGEVVFSNFLWLSIRHPDGFTVSYLHMEEGDHLVDVGDVVEAGQQIGRVGNAGAGQGMSFGCHLDLRINVAGNTNPEVAKLDTVADIGGDPAWSTYVHPLEFMRIFGVDLLVDGQAPQLQPVGG